jgi:nucleotide-binding universal stress UspA family protein
MIRQAETASRARGEQLAAKVAEEARNAGVDVTTETVRRLASILPDIAATHARYYDYALCGWEAGNETSRLLAETVVFGSGRPVVLLPELHAIGSLEHVAVAWDGSRVAARALADAGHLLRRARKISVLTVMDEKPLQEKDPGRRLVASLGKRGLDATAVGITCEDCPIESSLQDHAKELGAGILVMGAFGHSRLREFVLGGATRGVLADLRMPVMLSH